MKDLETVLKELEEAWVSGLEAALQGFAKGAGPTDRLYALAFWSFYAETGAVIYPPAVGLGFEAAVADLYPDESLASGFGSGSWNPAGWPVCAVELPNVEELRQGYNRLAEIACGGIDPEAARDLPAGSLDEVFWKKIFDQSLSPVRSTCFALTKRARRRQGPL